MGRETGAAWIDDREHASTPETVLSEFVDRDLPRHLALFYESDDVRSAVCAAFAKHELSRGRQFLYLYDDSDAAHVRATLGMTDIDVDRRIEAGDLLLEDASQVYLEEGFDPDQMIEALEATAAAALEDGYSGLSAAGENTWCFHTTLPFDHVLKFEADFDARVPDLPITALCQYSLDRFDQESIGKALWTHELVVYRGRLCENPFYVPPGEFRRSETPQTEVQLMLEQLYSLSQTRRDLGRREQRIDVLNRTLRHNVRNEINVVLGHLDNVLEGSRLHETDRRRIETARQHAENVSQTSDKARYVEQTLSTAGIETIDLRRIVAEAVESLRGRHPNADVTAALEATRAVVADENLPAAVDELLENAVRHQDGTSPRVSVSLRTDATTVVLDIENPGKSIPADDRRALREGRETSLRHGRGIGLWMVKWIVENSHGRMRFPPVEDGTRVRIEFPETYGVDGE
jgi:signal transduction histidine kinase